MTISANKALAESLWIYHIALSCCAIEVEAAGGPRFDWERLGCKFVDDHRNADVLLVSGPVPRVIASDLRKVYEEMRSPRYVVAVGGCASTGGMFSIVENNISGADSIIPIDLFIPGCPPRPESLIHAILRLQENLGRSK